VAPIAFRAHACLDGVDPGDRRQRGRLQHGARRTVSPVSSERGRSVGDAARNQSTARGVDRSAVSLPNFLSWKNESRTLDLAAFSGQSLTWTGREYAERVEALAPTASFRDIVGTPLHRGRWFTADEQRRGQHRVAVLGHRFWRDSAAIPPSLGNSCS
jgi:hypothetical protein